MNVGELKAALADVPDDTPVIARNLVPSKTVGGKVWKHSSVLEVLHWNPERLAPLSMVTLEVEFK